MNKCINTIVDSKTIPFNRFKCLKIPFCLIVLHDSNSLLYSVGPENGTLNNDHAQGNGRKTERFTAMASISIKHLKAEWKTCAKMCSSRSISFHYLVDLASSQVAK